MKLITRVNEINAFIEEELPRIKEHIRSLPEEHGQGYDELNELFYISSLKFAKNMSWR